MATSLSVMSTPRDARAEAADANRLPGLPQEKSFGNFSTPLARLFGRIADTSDEEIPCQDVPGDKCVNCTIKGMDCIFFS